MLLLIILFIISFVLFVLGSYLLFSWALKPLMDDDKASYQIDNQEDVSSAEVEEYNVAEADLASADSDLEHGHADQVMDNADLQREKDDKDKQELIDFYVKWVRSIRKHRFPKG